MMCIRCFYDGTFRLCAALFRFDSGYLRASNGYTCCYVLFKPYTGYSALRIVIKSVNRHEGFRMICIEGTRALRLSSEWGTHGLQLQWISQRL